MGRRRPLRIPRPRAPGNMQLDGEQQVAMRLSVSDGDAPGDSNDTRSERFALAGMARDTLGYRDGYPASISTSSTFSWQPRFFGFPADQDTIWDSSSENDDSGTMASEYMLLRGSNPFLPIDERESLDVVEAFSGRRAIVKISIPHILIGAAIGLGLGIMLSTLKVSPVVAEWVALPGSLFVRAIKSLVVPYVFCSVAVAIGDIVYVGKASAVGIETLKVFLTESATSTAAGLAIALLFRSFFRPTAPYSGGVENAIVLACANGLALEMHANASVTCSANASVVADTSTFQLDDVKDVFEKTQDAVDTGLGLSKQLLSILATIVPNNIFSAMYNAELLSVITFAMVMGAIAGRNFFTRTRRVNYLYVVLLQLRNTFFLAIEWLIWITPVAIISIVAGSFAANQDSLSKVSDVYMYLVADVVGMVTQIFVVLPFVHFLFTRCSPYGHMRQMVRAYLFAFCSASSLATAPITLSCIHKARASSQSLSNFVVSLGVVANMSGGGWYYPIGLVFLAESSGNGDQLTGIRLVAIYFLSLVGCSATPPIPSGGIALMSTFYMTVFATSELPSTWAFYVAMDIFADRLSTICNVNDDIIALRVIAENTDETVAGDHLGQRK